ncbi:SURF1 family protein [Demequina pelophila]|uniref:SURF1 family protein n=1 Tax=Demequina pelophila TaxID=1638984 RepID=UPI0007831B56|nr:SURF1 family protein [Demequina pelophila]
MPHSPARRALTAAIIVAVGLAVSVVGVRAGAWQYGKHVARSEAIAASDANASLPPASLEEAVGTDLAVDATEEWRAVEVTGRIVGDSLTLLRNRPVDRERVYQLLVWMETDSGRALLLNAGHIPVPGPLEDLAVPAWPAGDVTVTAVLRQSEPDDGRRDDGATRIAAAQMPAPPAEPIDGYAVVTQACSADGCVDAFGSPVPLPTLSLGPHLAYAWQWWAFALIAPVGGVLLARREWVLSAERTSNDESEPAPAPPAAGPAPPAAASAAAPPAAAPSDAAPGPASVAARKRARPARPARASARRTRELSDEEIEDAL